MKVLRLVEVVVRPRRWKHLLLGGSGEQLVVRMGMPVKIELIFSYRMSGHLLLPLLLLPLLLLPLLLQLLLLPLLLLLLLLD